MRLDRRFRYWRARRANPRCLAGLVRIAPDPDGMAIGGEPCNRPANLGTLLYGRPVHVCRYHGYALISPDVPDDARALAFLHDYYMPAEEPERVSVKRPR